MLSPCIRPGTISNEPYNHYSLLRSIEDNFGLPHLGFAAQADLRPLGEDILNNPSCPAPRAKCKKKRHKKHRRHAAAAKKHKHMQCKKKRKKRRLQPAA